MAHLLKNLTNSIWHAFHALQASNDASNTVLTANIGTTMDLYGVEKGLEHYRSTQSLTFEQYIYYLQKEVFSSITDATSVQTLKALEEGIDEICWLVCKKLYLERSHPVFDDHSVYQLFRIYCLLAETESDTDTDSYTVIMHSDEVARIASHLVMSLGLQWDAADFSALSAAIEIFRFSTFLAVLESKYSGGNTLDAIALTEAIDDLYQIYVENVVKKGYLMKKGFLLPTLRYFWFVLRPGELAYYKDPQQKEPSGLILLNANCWADTLTNGGKPDRRFVLSTPEHRCIELVAEDHKGRLQWLAALQTAIQHSGEKIGYQRSLANQRRSSRQATKQEREETKLELQHERQARIAAEIQARKLETLSKEEGAKVQQLEDVKQKLELLLQEEKQALRDEEIVRNLQARVLREEWEKREQLERLQQEQQELLEMEKMKRMEFERMQKKNEQQLQDAELRLQQLEAEREQLDSELRTAREKVKRAEEAQLLLETQIVTRPLRGGERIRRTQSFIPTTKERPLSVEKIDSRPMTLQKNI
ncbi:PREDICTED: differentially expressed in FDCP 6 homolog isoform X2 [Vollenhovia emeryi]|uniref:differentially expressed in FDCP 6 homolog isoform X2 n=1 Tax=Vollenhovia emeryi TaxID=411798 RepID=UPI0005F4E2B2|nr:PREDICTED: differentially expressed in FDCP 6 homolog isoform X2 [Vollenhovia emeryi]